MKAIRFDRTGGPEVLSYRDHDLPPPGAGQVRVRHRAIGVNFIDIYHRSGLYPLPLPSGLGSEAAGVVEALGAGVAGFAPGMRVGYSGGALGAYAEANNVPADKLIRIPDTVSDEAAAAALLKGMTAQYLLKRTYAVSQSETILFHSAAGGVGSIACQWAAHLGATVIGTVGSPAKVEAARAAGCAHVVLLKPGWQKEVRAIAPDGVPVVYDSVGKDTFEASLDCLSTRGLMVSFGNSSGAVTPFPLTLLMTKGSLYVTRPTLGHYTRDAKETQATADDLFAVIASGAVTIAVNQRFPLKDAAQAHEALAGRRTIGATVLIP
jgi:NADPH2:quinone reductase